MDDLQLIAGGKLSGSPAIARDQLAIELDGDTIRLHAKLSDKLEESGDTREFSLFAVDGKGHSAILARKSIGSMKLCESLQPLPLLNSLGNFQSASAAYTLERFVDVLSLRDQHGSRHQR